MSLFHLKLGERKTKSCETVTPGCTDSSINVRLAVSYLQFPPTCGGACSVRVRLNVGRSLHAAGINVITYHERVRAISPHSHVDKKLSLHVETRGGLLACRTVTLWSHDPESEVLTDVLDKWTAPTAVDHS